MIPLARRWLPEDIGQLYSKRVESSERYPLPEVQPSIPEILMEQVPSPTRDRDLSMPRVRFHLILFGITCLTTTVTGMAWWAAEQLRSSSLLEPVTWAMKETANGHLLALANGLLFTLTLLGILGAHEFGHYFACRYYGVTATLPFFLPAPPLITFFGTFGAVIKIRTPITTWRALFDIGIAGPLAGFALALPASVVGLWVAQEAPVRPPIAFDNPPLFRILMPLLHAPEPWAWNPTAWAAWGALLITALNLFPVGQLDGGHVLYAIAGRHIHKWVSIGTSVAVACLAVASFIWHGSPIWLLWTGVLFFMTKAGHPPIMDEEPLGAARTVLVIVAVIVFLVCFMPFPISIID